MLVTGSFFSAIFLWVCGLWCKVSRRFPRGTQLSKLAEEIWERVCSLNLAAPCRWRMQYIVQTYLRMEKLRCNTFSSISGCTSGVKRVNLLRWPHEALPSKDHPHGVFSLLDCCSGCGLRKRLQWFCERIVGKMINSSRVVSSHGNHRFIFSLYKHDSN
jgi:hypothetical protein